MQKIRQNFDIGSVIIILTTLVLFVVALFVKGFTKDLLVEIAVFLVSVKLIMNAYKNSLANKALQEKLNEMQTTLNRIESQKRP